MLSSCDAWTFLEGMSHNGIVALKKIAESSVLDRRPSDIIEPTESNTADYTEYAGVVPLVLTGWNSFPNSTATKFEIRLGLIREGYEEARIPPRSCRRR